MKFVAYWLGLAMLLAFFLLVILGVLAGGSFCIGWFACGAYALMYFCRYGEGRPENVGGTSAAMIILGVVTLLVILSLAFGELADPPTQKQRGTTR